MRGAVTSPRVVRPEAMRHPPDARRPRAAGYTMVEVLIVLAVASILAVMMGPSVSGLRGAQAVRGARGEIVAVIEAARGAALQRGRLARLEVRRDDTLVAIADDGSAAGYQVVATANLHKVYGVALDTSAAPSQLWFDGRGLANPRLASTARYVVTYRATKQTDSVCVSRMGLLLPRGCGP